MDGFSIRYYLLLGLLRWLSGFLFFVCLCVCVCFWNGGGVLVANNLLSYKL